MTQAAAQPKTFRYRLDGWLREQDRRAKKYDRTRRFREAILGVHGGHDLPHRIMAAVGRDDSGNWGAPRGRDLYIRNEWIYGPDPVSKGERRRTVTQHAMTAWDGVERGEEWRTFDWQDDGTTLRIGWLGDDGRIHDSGIQGEGELRLFRRWLIWDSWAKAEWFGLRRWIYYRALHAAVERKRPWTCQVIPSRDSGGYSHWHCDVRIGVLGTLRRRLGLTVAHDGPHRFANYRWDGDGCCVAYDPRDGVREAKLKGGRL